MKRKTRYADGGMTGLPTLAGATPMATNYPFGGGSAGSAPSNNTNVSVGIPGGNQQPQQQYTQQQSPLAPVAPFRKGGKIDGAALRGKTRGRMR